MGIVLCPRCDMGWEYDRHAAVPLLTIRCTCGHEFIPEEVLSMPRTPNGPGVDSVKLDVIYTDENGVPDGGKHAEVLLKRRAGDQPLPTSSDSPAMQDLVIADVEARKAIGLKRYGTLLQAHNGRDALRDAYEEALDLCQYLRQVLYERDGR